MPLLHSMQNAITMPEKTRLVWQIVLMHGVDLFNYKMIDSLVVSKNHDAILRSTADCRKQFFMQKNKHLKEIKDLEWNIYGTTCARVKWDKAIHYGRSCSCVLQGYCLVKQVVMLERLALSSPDFSFQCASWYRFHGCLPHKPRAVCSAKGNVRFYGYGAIQIADDEKSGNVMKYCLDHQWENMQQACITYINEQKVSLKTFLEFPALLKAFLNSTVIVLGPPYRDDEIYALEGVEIHKNYQKWKQYFSTPQYNSFNDLPKFIRKAIVGRYNEQKIERRKLIC
jgi:hypothetical protein